MKLRPFVLGLLAFAVVGWSFGAVSAADATKKSRVLMLTQSAGFKHGSVTRQDGQLSPAEIVLTQIGQQSGLFDVDCTQDAAADFTKENLENYDIVAFYTSGDLPIPQETLNYFLNDWLKQPGHGFLGFHSATDTLKNNEPYWDFIGGSFIGHPWTQNAVVTITVHDPSHPAMQPFGEEVVIQDEIYQYNHWQPEKVRVLMSLNMEKCDPKMPWQVPLAWVKPWGEGKMFYTNLGHRPETWSNKEFQDSIIGAVKWLKGMESGDATPNPEVSQEEQAKAKAVCAALGITEETIRAQEAENAKRIRALIEERRKKQEQKK